jgi:hypothetical protein
VSHEAARTVYSVIIAGTPLAVDEEATTRARDDARRQRLERVRT